MLDMAKRLRHARVRDAGERETLSNLLHALNIIKQKCGPDITVNNLIGLIQVARFPGITQKRLMGKLALTNSGLSSMVARLSIGEKGRAAGMELISSEDHVQDRRFKVLELTGDGDLLFDNIMAALRRQGGADEEDDEDDIY